MFSSVFICFIATIKQWRFDFQNDSRSISCFVLRSRVESGWGIPSSLPQVFILWMKMNWLIQIWAGRTEVAPKCLWILCWFALKRLSTTFTRNFFFAGDETVFTSRKVIATFSRLNFLNSRNSQSFNEATRITSFAGRLRGFKILEQKVFFLSAGEP